MTQSVHELHAANVEHKSEVEVTKIEHNNYSRENGPTE